ncbi:MAG: methyltransferase domain-containing protein [Patescibacteria group bacterium]|nr:methyltransferase domain-containing protein [Patescibacteria group bacterium]
MKCTICDKNVTTIITKELRKGEKRNVYLCENCELGILDSNLSAEELKKFYSEEYRKIGTPNISHNSNPQELFDTYSKFQEERIKILSPYLNKKTKLLEVGCSAGMFLYNVKNQVKEIVGIDFDKKSAEYTSKKCGCKVYTTDIKETPLPKKYFNVIVAFQTLEHVKNPHDFINNLKEYLAPGGMIVMEVPNLYDALVYLYDLPKHKRFYYHSSHLWYFTEKSLKLIIDKSGFKGKVYHTQDYNVLNHFHWVDTDTPDSDCNKGLNKPILPLRKERSEKMKKAISNFIISVDKDYKKMLAHLKITSNIIYIGKLK